MDDKGKAARPALSVKVDNAPGAFPQAGWPGGVPWGALFLSNQKPSLPPVELAALTMFANQMLNLDEVLNQ